MLIKNEYKAGDLVKVKAITPPIYSLPDDLPDGATVKVIAQDIGRDQVEYLGKQFWVSMVLIDSGFTSLPNAEFRIPCRFNNRGNYGNQ